MIWGDRGLASAPVSASTSRQWGEFLEGLIRRRAFKRHARNLHLHRIHNHHLDLQGVIHTVLPPCTSRQYQVSDQGGREVITYQSKPPPSASQSPRRHISLYISRPPTTTSQPSAQPLDPTSHYVQTPQPIHHYTCLSCGAFPTQYSSTRHLFLVSRA